MHYKSLALLCLSTLAAAYPEAAPLPQAADNPPPPFSTQITPGATIYTAYYWSVSRTTVQAKATACPTTTGASAYASASATGVCGAGCIEAPRGWGNADDPWYCTPYERVSTSINKSAVGTTTCSSGFTVTVGTDLWGLDPDVPQTYCVRAQTTVATTAAPVSTVRRKVRGGWS